MDAEEFRKRGEEVIDYIVDYLESISRRRVMPDVKPGFLRAKLPTAAPKKGESFEKILEDFEKYIMPGMTHWQHPHFHAYFPANYSYPSILGDMLSDSVGCSKFDWNISPGGKELETIVMDWYGKMVGLPDHLLYYGEQSNGGGCIVYSISESVCKCLHVARNEILDFLKENNPQVCREFWLPCLVAYCSKEAHSSIEKAAMICMINMRVLDVDEKFRLRGETVSRAIEQDKRAGMIPFFVAATLGTTSCCSVDVIHEIGPVCEAHKLWFHVDAAYGGTALVCPEYRHLIKGIEYASSISINPAKWMLTAIDCAALWVKDRSKISETLVYDKTEFDIWDENYFSTSSKRFQVLRLFAVIRSYSIEGLQKHVRHHVRLAEMFTKYVQSDERFEVITSQFGLVCFRLKGCNSLNKQFQMAVNASGKLHIIGCDLEEKFTIRFCVCAPNAKEVDISYAWSVLSDLASDLLKGYKRELSKQTIEKKKKQ